MIRKGKGSRKIPITIGIEYTEELRIRNYELRISGQIVNADSTRYDLLTNP